MNGLTLDEAHVYRKDGRIVPGVTRVIDAVLRDLTKIPQHVLAAKGELGTLVHQATALDATGELDESTVDPEVAPYLKAWRKFRFEVKPKILSTEELVYSEVYGYAGTLDHQMEIGADYGIVDKKTSAPDLIDAVQLSAYAQAKQLRRAKLWVLQLKPDATYRLHPYDDHFHVFLAALTCYRFRFGRE